MSSAASTKSVSMEPLNHTLENTAFYDICPLPNGDSDIGNSYFQSLEFS